MDSNKKSLIALSGGPDSMFLLNKLNSEGVNLVAVMINYNWREESVQEVEMVTKYCKENGIELIVDSIPKDFNYNEAYPLIKNKQAQARHYRYDKFKEVCLDKNIDTIFVAHHKDDFLETALMQESRSSDYVFYGIKEHNVIDGINIERPLLNFYKEDIIKYNDELNIPYAIDKSNFKPVYERNRLRIELKDWTKEEKDSKVEYFKSINESKASIRKETEKLLNKWKDDNYSYDYYKNSIPDNLKKYVIYSFLIMAEQRINISSDKIDGIIDFLKEKKGDKGYRLMENVFLGVRDSIIILYEK